MMNPIWIADDDPSIRFVLEKALQRHQLSCRSFINGRDVQSALVGIAAQDMPSLLISDIRMPGGSGLDLLQTVKAQHPQLPIIIMTAYSDLDSAVAAFQHGAFEYLPKPFDIHAALALIDKALAQHPATASAEPVNPMPNELLGQAPAMQVVFRTIGRLAASQATVLITGESGSGKELVARALHKHSVRKQGPFVAINTAAIPKELLESELFGHEKGSFTGATTQHRGRFEQAEGGTLFLDEIGDMPFDMQTRLLRVLSDGHYYRVGGHSALKSNVRVIAATHQHLEQRVQTGHFREDLYHRLNVIRMRLPTLRERKEDIPTLTHHFLALAALQNGMPPKAISQEALELLCQFDFPGNVRQLENFCQWLTVMSPSHIISKADLPPEVLQHLAKATHASFNSHCTPNSSQTRTSPQTDPIKTDYEGHRFIKLDADNPQNPNWETALHQTARDMLEAGTEQVWNTLIKMAESQLLQAALALTEGKRQEAAQLLGIGRNTLTRKLQELNLDHQT